MTATINNGSAPRTRRQLNDSIQKMDGLIEGLSQAIPDTIRDALEENVGRAVAEGVRGAIIELLSNPELLATLKNAIPPATPPAPPQPPIIVPVPQASLLGRLASKVKSSVVAAAVWGRDKVVTAAKTIANTACLVATKFSSLGQRLWAMRLAPKAVVLALAVGSLVVAVAAVFAPSLVVVTIGGVSGFCLGAAAQLGLWFRQGCSRLTLATD